ncbi:tryptophan RNA-binding attenuator protein-like domain-containing protein [Pseudomassariella vexata]|uniref:Altered inheritance of mitochondria protein 24, mitochondrial n=1 Tax=Pseudomassariella vexata TaxID=1141098 RepID=A0A1Y2DK23_9PEZI|nr:tryptophan RNA-binding attenuator protein-like domain-containing protein [Pseudomassariella vexata]ORY59494.1 tryptophan RNA-binding attenuator protein-like domain-containing protein [Pseudomassariella vexata]
MSYYPPPPGAVGSPAQQKNYPPPPQSPPANQTKFYPPPLGTPSFAPPQGQSYPAPPQIQHQQNYPPPPQQSTSSPPPKTGTPVPYPPPSQAAQHMNLPLRNSTPSINSPSPAPPGYETAPPGPGEGYPQEKIGGHSQQGSVDLTRRASGMSQQPSMHSVAQGGGQLEGQGGQFSGAHSATADDVGTFNGGSYRISHRDCNTIITIQLAMGCPIDAKPGVLIAMSPTITLKGEYKFSMKKMIAGGEVGHSTFVGPGELLLAPSMLGDITTIRLTGNEAWSVSKDAYVCSTQGVNRDYKRQGLGKAMFSGEGLWVHKVKGIGLMWITSFGAIIRKNLQDGEKYIVDNGHLVAWNVKYIMERVASGGIMAGFASGEGLVCKFTGPGTVFLQTRNPRAFSAYMTGNAAPP